VIVRAGHLDGRLVGKGGSCSRARAIVEFHPWPSHPAFRRLRRFPTRNCCAWRVKLREMGQPLEQRSLDRGELVRLMLISLLAASP